MVSAMRSSLIEGSSSSSLVSEEKILSSSPLDLADRENEIRLGRGSAQTYWILLASSQSVSPVVVSFSFAIATIDPGPASVTGFCSLPAMVNN